MKTNIVCTNAAVHLIMCVPAMLLLLASCTTPQSVEWREPPGKTDQEAKRDISQCKLIAGRIYHDPTSGVEFEKIDEGIFGECMTEHGYTPVEK
jgi:hypothetical protein